MSLKIFQRPLPYAPRLDRRCTDAITLIVIHCTELPDLVSARVWGEKEIYRDSRTGNSGHFYIDRDGRVEEWVPVTRIAHHARSFNRQSIGIELVNKGRFPHWFQSTHQQMEESYPEAQIRALLDLLQHLETDLPGLKEIAGHEDLDTDMLPSEDQPGIMIRRKVDPGPCFPWQKIQDHTALKRWSLKTP